MCGLAAVNHLVFFDDWYDFSRDFVIDVLPVSLLAYTIARSIGRAHWELFRAKREAERLSRTDPLTGLSNRRAFFDAAKRLEAAEPVLAIFDIDRFKRINDRFGHGAGDEVIRAVAERMQAELGDLGVVARLGGEEFALVGPAQPAEEIRARLRGFRQRVGDAGGELTRVTVSVGFAIGGGRDVEALYAAADKALYRAKAAGRDCVVDSDDVDDALQEAS